MMYTPNKNRRIVATANSCLVAGLMLLLFAHPASQLPLDVVHGVAGLLLGLCIGLNLTVVICRKRQPRVGA